jgi:hypothetical protein
MPLSLFVGRYLGVDGKTERLLRHSDLDGFQDVDVAHESIEFGNTEVSAVHTRCIRVLVTQAA